MEKRSKNKRAYLLKEATKGDKNKIIHLVSDTFRIQT